MRPWARCFVAIAAVPSTLLAQQVTATPSQPLAPIDRSVVSNATVYTLERCLRLAEQNYPKVHAAAAQLTKMKAQVWEAQTAPFSQFEATAGVGLAPTVGGTALYSPDTDAALTALGMAPSSRGQQAQPVSQSTKSSRPMASIASSRPTKRL